MRGVDAVLGQLFIGAIAARETVDEAHAFDIAERFGAGTLKAEKVRAVRNAVKQAPAPQRGTNDGEVVIEFPRPLETVTAVRSTLITSSLAALRERGLFERYDALQRTPHRDVILNCVAGEWLDLEVGFAHYRTCDALGLTRDEQVGIGKDVSKRIHETFLRMIVGAARGMGVTPWALLSRGDSLQARLNRGGGVRLIRLASRSARIEIAACPLLDVTYFRNALLGIYIAGVELLASKVTARMLPAESKQPGERLVLRLDWGEA